MTDIDSIVNDVRIAAEDTLSNNDGDYSKYRTSIESIVDKVRVIVQPVLHEQEKVIENRDRTIREYADTIEELIEKADNLEGQTIDRDEEDERQEIIKQWEEASHVYIYHRQLRCWYKVSVTMAKEMVKNGCNTEYCSTRTKDLKFIDLT